MRKTTTMTFSLIGLAVAVVLAAIRIYMLLHQPEYDDALYSEWFTILTLVLWPSAFYLSILMEKEPASVVVKIWTIAILFNPLIYAGVGWTVSRISRLFHPRPQ
jgi:hypothetical protein